MGTGEDWEDGGRAVRLSRFAQLVVGLGREASVLVELSSRL